MSSRRVTCIQRLASDALIGGLLLYAGPALSAQSVKAYVTNDVSNSVSVINTTTNTVVATIPVGLNPKGIAVKPDGSRVYVANYSSNTISVINPINNSVTSIGGFAGPVGVSFNRTGSRAYVTNNTNNTVSVIDTASNAVFATTSVGAGPAGSVVTAAGTEQLYVANQGDGTVSIVDSATNLVTGTVAIGGSPITVINSPGDDIVVSETGGGISRYNRVSDTVTSIFTSIDGADGLAYSQDGSKLLIAKLNGNSVGVVNSGGVETATITVGSNPAGLARLPSGSRLYVVNTGSNSVQVIDTVTNSLVGAPIPVGSSPSRIAIAATTDPDLNPVPALASWASTLLGGLLAGVVVWQARRITRPVSKAL